MIVYLTGTACSMQRIDSMLHPLRMIQRVDKPWEKIHIKLARQHLQELKLQTLVTVTTGLHGFDFHNCRWLVLMGYGCAITEEDYSWAVLF